MASIDSVTIDGVIGDKSRIPAPLVADNGANVYLPLDARAYAATESAISNLRKCYPGLLVLVGDTLEYYKILETGTLGKPTRYEKFVTSSGSDSASGDQPYSKTYNLSTLYGCYEMDRDGYKASDMYDASAMAVRIDDIITIPLPYRSSYTVRFKVASKNEGAVMYIGDEGYYVGNLICIMASNTDAATFRVSDTVWVSGIEVFEDANERRRLSRMANDMRFVSASVDGDTVTLI